jgi:arylsulfatase
MESVGREVLPIPHRPDTGTITYDAADPDTSFPPISQVRPPEGAPNVVVVLLDDVGFGASSAFGGPCATPTFERLAGNGLKYTRFHTAAMCAPTRTALLVHGWLDDLTGFGRQDGDMTSPTSPPAHDRIDPRPRYA